MKDYIEKIRESIKLDCFYGTDMSILSKYKDGNPEIGYKTLDEAISEEKDGVRISLEKSGALNFYPVFQDKQNVYYHNLILSFGEYRIIFNSRRMGIVDADYYPTVFCVEKGNIIKKTKIEIEKIIFSNFFEFSSKYTTE